MPDLGVWCRQLGIDILGCLFLASGIGKLFAIKRFREGLLYIPYLKPLWTYLIAFTLPPVEIATAVGLFANSTLANWVALGLLALFLVVSLVVVSKRLRLDCHCFGDFGGRDFSRKMVLENGLLLGFAVFGFDLSDRPTAVTEISTAALLLILYCMLNQMLRNAHFVTQMNQRGMA